MSESPLVSIVIPTFNAAAYLPIMCESILKQTLTDFEAVILDDGSSDNTAAVLVPFAKDRRFRCRRWEKNRGLNAAMREVIGSARGKYWICPGADDVLMPELLEARVAMLEATPDAWMAHGAIQVIDENGNARANRFRYGWPRCLDAAEALREIFGGNFIVQPSAMVRSEVTRKVLPYFDQDWKYAADWFLWILHLGMGMNILWDDRPLVHYREHGSSLTGSPTMAAARVAEFRLVPLCALKAASRFSSFAEKVWVAQRESLYRRWLARAVRLAIKGNLREDWMRLAAASYYGTDSENVSLMKELGRHGIFSLMLRR
jgi:glycosyltransferase involved in cell wall biosynthesis